MKSSTKHMPRRRFLQLVGAILFPVAYSVPVVAKETLVIAGSKLSDVKPTTELLIRASLFLRDL
jgi:hypothetical protein